MSRKFVEILTLLILLFPIISFGQGTSRRLAELYAYVRNTDSLLNKSERTFYLEKFLKDNYNYKETWHYLTDNGRIIYFEVNYFLDSTEYTEIYYLKRGNLVCSEEYEKINYSYLEDELKWGGIYYYDSAMPIHVVTLGRQDSYKGVVNPETLSLNKFMRRYNELKQNLPTLPENY
jgi:hypothetical protein